VVTSCVYDPMSHAWLLNTGAVLVLQKKVRLDSIANEFLILHACALEDSGNLHKRPCNQ